MGFRTLIIYRTRGKALITLRPCKKRPFLTAVKEELLRKGDKDSSYAWFAQLKVSPPIHQQEEMLGTTREE
jgi:hypothetical protein